MDGPHLYMLALGLAMPLLYSLPTALISAELATNYPETGGQCVYVSLACGPLVGAHNTWWYVHRYPRSHAHAWSRARVCLCCVLRGGPPPCRPAEQPHIHRWYLLDGMRPPHQP